MELHQMTLNKRALNAYRSVGASSAVSYADRIQLVQMLFDATRRMNNIDRPSPHGQAGRFSSSSVRTRRSTARTKEDKEIPLQTIPTS